MSYAIRKDGLGWRAVSGPDDVGAAEVYSDAQPDISQAQQSASNNAQIKAQLADLDGKSVRALHEAVLALAASGSALPADTVKRLQDIESQKTALRAQLVPQA